MTRALLTVCLLAAPDVAFPKPIRFPEPPAATSADPVVVLTLTSDELYVVTADVACLLLASPPGVVAVAEHAGPVTVHAKFAGGPGRFETKTFSAKQVFLVTAVSTGRAELLAVPSGATAEKQVVRRLLDAQVGPRPPPPPDDDPLLQPLQAAYLAADAATRKADALALAGVYRNETATADPALPTLQALSDALARQAHAAIPLPRLSGVRQVLQAELGRQLGTAGATPLDAALRAKAKAQFRRFAALLTEVAK